MAVKVGLKYNEIWQESMEDKVLEYESEVQEKNKIVFYGPSYFTRWSTHRGMVPLKDVLLGKSGAKCAINRGFGSSCAEHQLYYYPRLVRPLEPSVLVYCPCANYSNFGYSTEENWELAQRVLVYAMTDFPGIHIYLCGPHNQLNGYNQCQIADLARYESLMRNFCQNNPNCTYVDVMSYEPLKRKDIYVEDGIHFNQLGYDIYGEFFKEVLKDELAKF